jgi:hypothetical protein
MKKTTPKMTEETAANLIKIFIYQDIIIISVESKILKLLSILSDAENAANLFKV